MEHLCKFFITSVTLLILIMRGFRKFPLKYRFKFSVVFLCNLPGECYNPKN